MTPQQPAMNQNINKAIEQYITSIMCEAIQKDLADANIYWAVS